MGQQMTDSCPALPTRCSGDQYGFISVAHAGLSLPDLRNLAVADAYHGSDRCSQSRVSCDVPRSSCAGPHVVNSSAHSPRGRSRRRLATLSNGNVAGLVHSSRFSFKSSNLRRDPKFRGSQLPRRPEPGETCNQDRLSRRPTAQSQYAIELCERREPVYAGCSVTTGPSISHLIAPGPLK